MMFVYHYVIIPFHPQYLPRHATQGGGCQGGGCRGAKLSSFLYYLESRIKPVCVRNRPEKVFSPNFDPFKISFSKIRPCHFSSFTKACYRTKNQNNRISSFWEKPSIKQTNKQHLNEADFIGPCLTKVEGPKFGRHPVLADTSTVTHYNVYFISEDVNLPCWHWVSACFLYQRYEFR